MSDSSKTTPPMVLRRVGDNEFASPTGTIRVVQTGFREWYVMNPAGERMSEHFTSPRRAAMSIGAEFVGPTAAADR